MENLIKNQIYPVVITGYSSEGDGVGHINGKAVFVKGAIMDEECLIKILKDTKNIAYGKIEKILSPSAHRTAPACPVFGKCGGCRLMHMDYEEEKRFKLQRVDDALSRIGGLDIALSGIIGADEVNYYRNKAIFAAGKNADGAPVTGFFRQRSHDIIPVDECLIQSREANSAASAVRRWMENYSVPPYDEKNGSGVVRHIFSRYGKASRKLQVVIVSASGSLPNTRELISSITSACPETESIVLNINKTTGNTVLAGKFVTLWGKDYIEDSLCGIKYELSPLSFYQINHDQAEKLYSIAVDFACLNGDETVLDLYCGTGTITLCLSKKAGKVIGAEIVDTAIADALRNAEKNNIKNAEFICADASVAASEFKKRGLSPDVVVVDPPRKGLAPDVIASISEMTPTRVVYVSCDPATLARDLKIFFNSGYKAKKAVAVDMFPRTPHVETVVLMSKIR